ncbi:MAG: ATPase [Nitrospinaceae bacterium]|nr:MAG: ATPase [Nitrospinaceae bacterium]
MSLEVPESLQALLLSVDGRGYKAYKILQGKSFPFPPFEVVFEHVQGDPFAFPSRISVAVDLTQAGFSKSFYETKLKRLAFEDHLLRVLHENIGKTRVKIRGSGKSGQVRVQVPSQKVLKRSAVIIEGNRLQCIVFAGLPAEGRTILAKECLRLFSEVLSPLWTQSLLASSLDLSCLQRSLDTLADHTALQAELEKRNWVGFVANGSLLPRESGVSDKPLIQGGIEFEAPEGLSEVVDLPHSGRVAGMPIPRGITLVVGGGFHGKSTLLRALQHAVYPHVAGDGRERVATLNSAVKIRAEDGRAVRGVDVSGFMNRLPGVESTQNFSTQFASGSTSQAVNILEALEAGSGFLLLDEDTCATNFMIRDARMQALTAADKEPITPFIDRVGEIHDRLGISTLLVMGGSGDYFSPAHQVIAMEAFKPRLVTSEAKRIAQDARPGQRRNETSFPFQQVVSRRIDPKILNFRRGRKDCVIQTQGLLALTFGVTEVDTRYVEQLVEEGQLETCGWILKRLRDGLQTEAETNIGGIQKIYEEIDENGWGALTPYNNGLLALPRTQDVLAVLNRIR